VEGEVLFLTAMRWPREEGQNRIKRAENLFKKAEEAGIITPQNLFMLGHIQRLRGNQEKAVHYLTRAFEAGEERGALGLGIMYLSQKNTSQARDWLARFTKTENFPELFQDNLSYQAVKLIAHKLMELGQDVCPGFSRLPHDPAVWTAFEFYQSAFSAEPEDLDTARAMAGLLLNHGAAAEAMEVAQKAMEHHPSDEVLGSIFSQAGRASYLTLN
jgi:tetratricopeptide (TPR) repeat protein